MICPTVDSNPLPLRKSSKTGQQQRVPDCPRAEDWIRKREAASDLDQHQHTDSRSPESTSPARSRSIAKHSRSGSGTKFDLHRQTELDLPRVEPDACPPSVHRSSCEHLAQLGAPLHRSRQASVILPSAAAPPSANSTGRRARMPHGTWRCASSWRRGRRFSATTRACGIRISRGGSLGPRMTTASAVPHTHKHTHVHGIPLHSKYYSITRQALVALVYFIACASGQRRFDLCPGEPLCS